MTVYELVKKWPQLEHMGYTEFLQYEKTIIARKVIKRVRVKPNLPEEMRKDLKDFMGL